MRGEVDQSESRSSRWLIERVKSFLVRLSRISRVDGSVLPCINCTYWLKDSALSQVSYLPPLKEVLSSCRR